VSSEKGTGKTYQIEQFLDVVLLRLRKPMGMSQGTYDALLMRFPNDWSYKWMDNCSYLVTVYL
jgi:hypothetical protein